LKKFYQPLLVVTLAYLALGCVGTKHLKEGEYLLYNQKVEFADEHLRSELNKELVEKSNSRIWFLPISTYTYIYYEGLKTYDTAKYELKKLKVANKYQTKMSVPGLSEKKANRFKKRQNKKLSKLNKKIDEGNLLMRWGEPIVVFDSTKVEKSRKNMEVYMKANGWFLSEVDYKVNFEIKLARVNYVVKPGPRYTIDSIFYDIADSTVKKLVLSNQDESLLKKGSPYSQNNLSNERTRLDELLKNNGYFAFTRQYIQYRVDTTIGNKQVAVQLRILQPGNLPNHKSFIIDSVKFAVDAISIAKGSRRKTFTYKGVNYNFFDRIYSEKVLASRIHIKPGEPYSKQNTLNTQRELAGMDMFKFVNINYDSTANNFLANVFVSPLPRFTWSAEAGLTVTQSLPGPFAHVSLKQRNVFKTLGIFEIIANVGVEGVAAASNPNAVLASLEAGGNLSLTFPRFFLPLSDENKLKLGFYNPKSIIKGGISFTDRPEYTRSTLSIANAYTWQPDKNKMFDFKFIDIALVKTNKLDSAYLERLQDLEANGNNLINSFLPSFVSGQRLTRTVNINNYGQGFNNSSYFSLMVEPGGTFTNLWARDVFARDSLEIYAYFKLDTDYRKVVSGGRKKSWAFRIRSGIAVPYGQNGLLPYEKYFFSGGSISNRAWKQRRLGPGSYNHIEENGNVSYQFEQQGEIILESSIEYRQRLIGFLQWAAFVDAGNIWTIKEDNARPGSQFKFSKFYREIAIGAGLGLRFDFTFLIMRFDVSAKIVDPARPLGSRFILSSGFYNEPFNDPKFTEPIIYNLSIGYPF
jgi:Omp85 superfamily domain